MRVLRAAAPLFAFTLLACGGEATSTSGAEGPADAELDGGHVGDAADVAFDGSGSGEAPTANAGDDQRTAVSVPVVFDGTKSSDPEGAPLGYRWTIASRPPSSTAALAEAETAFPSLVPDRAGTYELRLIVNDGGRDSAPDVVRVEVVESGRFVPAFAGRGVITDPRTGGRLYLPPERRIHVWIAAEGYLASDLARFEADVDDWYEGFRTIDVLDAYREAFVVWKLPLASAARVATDGGTADTAFRVPISAGGGSIDPAVRTSADTTERVWSFVPEFPFAPTWYPGTTGRTSYLAKEIVVSMLVFDPRVGRAGFSGRGATFGDPTNPERRLSGAIALDTTHEFGHAFARLADEYMDGGNVLRDNPEMESSTWVSNVAKQPTCATLPWRHLFAGTAINPATEGLVGAFGSAVDGYHPELKCLMNGTRPANATEFGGDGRLRAPDRMCNWCRELTVFRLMERTSVLPTPATSWATWTSSFRGPFFERHGFHVPTPVPQQNSASEPVFRACAP